MVGAEMKKLIDEGVDAWNRHDVDELVDFFTDDCTLIEPLTGPLKGKEAVRGVLLTLFQAFPDMSVEVNDALGAGDVLALEWLAKGTHKGSLPPFTSLGATGRKVTMAGASFCHLRAGKIEREVDYTDMGRFLDQVGVKITDFRLAA